MYIQDHQRTPVMNGLGLVWLHNPDPSYATRLSQQSLLLPLSCTKCFITPSGTYVTYLPL